MTFLRTTVTCIQIVVSVVSGILKLSPCSFVHIHTISAYKDVIQKVQLYEDQILKPKYSEASTLIGLLWRRILIDFERVLNKLDSPIVFLCFAMWSESHWFLWQLADWMRGHGGWWCHYGRKTILLWCLQENKRTIRYNTLWRKWEKRRGKKIHVPWISFGHVSQVLSCWWLF